MRVIQKINNNVAIGLDGNNREVVLFGKGVGFPAIPYELTDLSKIDRTFYDVNERYYKLFDELDTNLLNLIGYMVDVIKSRIEGNWDPNLTFILADHINFSIQRLKMGMKIDFPYSYEIETEFPEFNKYAMWIVKNVNKKMHVYLEKGEITCIAMHLISAHEGNQNDGKETWSEKLNRILISITEIIEKHFKFKMDKKKLDYQRFRYHIQYFVKRKEAKEEIKEDNIEMFEKMKESYPETYSCVCKIQEFMEKEFKESCSKDELLYLMIHINRLYSKEDCNRKGITPDEN